MLVCMCSNVTLKLLYNTQQHVTAVDETSADLKHKTAELGEIGIGNDSCVPACKQMEIDPKIYQE